MEADDGSHAGQSVRLDDQLDELVANAARTRSAATPQLRNPRDGARVRLEHSRLTLAQVEYERTGDENIADCRGYEPDRN